jgi:hypothetical protein
MGTPDIRKGVDHKGTSAHRLMDQLRELFRVKATCPGA